LWKTRQSLYKLTKLHNTAITPVKLKLWITCGKLYKYYDKKANARGQEVKVNNESKKSMFEIILNPQLWAACIGCLEIGVILKVIKNYFS